MTTRLNEWAGAPGAPEPDDLVERAIRMYRAIDVQQDERAIYARLLEEAHIARQGGQRQRSDELERAAAHLRERWEGSNAEA